MPTEFKDLTKEVSKGTDDIRDTLKKTLTSTDKLDKAQQKLSKTQKSAIEISKKYEKSVKSLSDTFGKLKDSSTAAARGLAAIGKSRATSVMDTLSSKVDGLKKSVVELSKVRADINVTVSGSKDLEAIRKSAEKLTKIGLGKGFDSSAKSAKNLSRSVSGARKALSDASSSMVSDFKRADGVLGLLRTSFREGKKEAENFASGLGVSSTRMIAAGAAAAFLFKKAGELTGQFRNARMEVAKYRVDLATFGKTTIGTGASQLEGYRKQLGLTREQATQFFGVLRQGAEEGLLSVRSLASAAENIQKAFGGDPTAQLKEYVELLHEIPTLDTDLKITASLDDQSASLFDLARKGKISTVIELQQAGLLGGVDVSVTSPEDVEQLNAAQRTDKNVQSINDFLITKLFPSFGSQLTAAADYTFKVFSAVGGGFAIAGALNAMILRKQGENVRATRAVEHAVWATSGKGVAGGGLGNIKGTGGLLDTFKKSFKMSYRMRGGTAGAFNARAFSGAMQKAMSSTFNKASAGKGLLGTFTKSLKMSYHMRGGGAGAGAGATAKAGAGALGKATMTTLSKTGVGKEFMSLAKNSALLGKGMKYALASVRGFAGIVGIAGVALMAAGKVADWFGDKFEKEGNTMGAATSKFAGATLGALGTIVAFAAIGSIIPGVGTAIGAAVGALVGLGAVVWNQSDVLGTSMQNLGKELQGTTTVAGKAISKYGKTGQMFGKALEGAGKFVVGFGSAVKDVVKTSMTFLWSAIKETGKNLLLFGNPIGWTILGFKAFGKMLRSKEYNKVLTLNTKLAKKANKAWKDNAKVVEKTTRAMQESQERTMQSALALERQMKATANVVNSGKLAFADFRKEVASLEMGVFRELGGSVEAYATSVGKASKAVTDRFEKLTEGLADRRKKIMDDAKLEGTQRRQALLDLHNEELKATKAFVNSISELIIGLMDTPDVIKADLQTRIRKARIDFTMDAGALDMDSATKQIHNAFDSSAKAIEGTLKAFPEMQKESAKRRKRWQEADKKISQDALEVFADFPDTLKSRLGKVIKMKGDVEIPKESFDSVAPEVKKQLEKGIKSVSTKSVTLDVDTSEFDKLPDDVKKVLGGVKKETLAASGIDKEEAKKALSETTEAINAMEREIDKSAKIIEEGDAKSLAKKMNRLTDSFAKLREEQEAASDELKKAGKDVDKRKAAEDKISKITKESHELAQEQEGLQESIISTLKKRYGLDKESAKILSQMIAEGDANASSIDKSASGYKSAVVAYGSMADEQGKILSQIGRRNSMLKKHGELTKAEGFLQAAVGDGTDLAVIELTEAEKYMEKLIGEVRSYGDINEKLASLNSKEVADERRRLEFIQASASLAIQSGEGLSNLSDASQSGIKLYENMRAAAEKSLVEFEAQKKKEQELLELAQTSAQKDIVKAQIKGTEDAIKKVRENMAKNEAELVDIIRGFDKAVSTAMEGPAGRRVVAALDLSAAQFEMAEFSANTTAMAQESAEVAKKAAQERAAIEKMAIQVSLDNAKMAADALADTMEKSLIAQKVSPEVAKERADAVRSEQTRTAEAEAQAKIAKIETEEKKTALDAVEKATKLQMDQLDAAQGVLSTQLDLFETFGASTDKIAETLAKDLEIEKKRLTSLKAQAAESRRMTGDSLKTRQLELEVVKKESDIRKKDYENAKKIIGIRKTEVGISDEIIQAQLDFQMEMGGNLSTIMELQQGQVANARIMVDLAQQELEAAKARNADGLEIKQREKDVVLAQLNAQRKAMGVQRDVMEKMIGAALGGVRSAVGGRRQRMTDVGLMGVENTRLKTRAGMFMKTKPGEVKPYYQRVAELKGGAGGAKRLKPEQEMAKKLGGVETNTAETAKWTAAGFKAGLTGGSLFTHDMTSEGLLASILYVAKEMAVGIGNLATSQSVTGAATGDVRAKLEEGLEGVRSEVEKKGKAAEESAQKQVAAQSKSGDVAEKSSRVEESMAKDGEKSAKSGTESAKIDKKQLAMKKKDVRGFKSMVSDQRNARKMLEDMVRNGTEISGIKSGDRTFALPKEFSDEIGSLQKNFKDTGNISPGIDYLAKKVSDWGYNEARSAEKMLNEQEKTLDASNKQEKSQAKSAGSLSKIQQAQTKASGLGGGKFGGGLGGGKFGGGAHLGGGKFDMGAKHLQGGKFDMGAKHLQGGKFDMTAKNLQGGKFGGGGGLGGGKFSAMGGGRAMGADIAKKTGDAVASAVEAPPMTGVDTAEIAARSRSLEAKTASGADVFTAKPGLAAGGTAGGAMEAGGMKIEGRMTVHFDHAAFKDEVTKVVVEVLAGPEATKTLQNAGVPYMNK